jgi:hypothetical protein
MGCRFCAWIITAAHIALTSVVPWRSVDSLGSHMEKLTHRIARARASGIAIATILAMLIAPLCGSNCAGASGCGAGVGIVRSGAEDCHHTVSGSRDSEPSHSVSGKACSRQEAPAALLSAPEKSSSLRESLAFVGSFHSVKQNIHPSFDHSAHRARWGGAGDPPRAELLEITATILRI